MTIQVRPDPTRPDGGHAELSAAAEALPETEATVSVYDAFSERFLGADGWQSDRVEFGPYAVVHEGGRARLIVGPEIVNQIEEYAAVKLRVNGVEAAVDWPDDVVPLPGAARIGGLAVSRSGPSAPKDNLVGKLQAEAPQETTPAPAPAEPAEDPPTRSRLPLIAGLAALVLLLGGGVAAWFLMSGPAPAPPPTPAPMPVAAEEPAPCGDEALAALATMTFGEGRALMSRCAGAVGPERALAALENGAEAGDAEALYLFGQIYDDVLNDDPVEAEIGLSLTPSPPRAAEYYARARAAGSAAAAERLGQLCAELRAATDTLSKNAAEEFCPQ